MFNASEGNMKCTFPQDCVLLSEVSDDTVVFRIMLHHLTRYELSANPDAGLESYLGERSQGTRIICRPAQITSQRVCVCADLITHVPCHLKSSQFSRLDGPVCSE